MIVSGKNNKCYTVEPLRFSHHYTVSLVQWVNRLLPASGGGGQRFVPRGCTHTSGTGIACYGCLVILVTQCDPWSSAMIGPLTLATDFFSHPSYPSSILIGGHRLWRHTLGSNKAQATYPLLVGWGGPVEPLAISHTTTQSHLSSGSTVCFPPGGTAVCTSGVHPHFWNWDLLLAMSLQSILLNNL